MGIFGVSASFLWLDTRDFSEKREHLLLLSSHPHLLFDTLTGFGVRGLNPMLLYFLFLSLTCRRIYGVFLLSRGFIFWFLLLVLFFLNFLSP